MADAEDDEPEVLTSLPRSRPARRSAKRGDGDRAEATQPSTKPAPKAAAKRSGRSADTPEPPDSATAEAQQPDMPQPPETAAAEAQQPEPPQPEAPPAGDPPPSGSDGGPAAGATKIVATAVQAAVELAQIAVSVGRQVLRSAYERLPKP